jgi:uncharacterized membrane protein
MTDASDEPAAASLPAHIEEALASIGRLHSDHHQSATGLERTVDRLTGFLRRPRAAGLLAVGVAAWICLNLALRALGAASIDPPPFSGLQCVASVGALFMTLFILATQRRADELSELREQLTLEMTMLSEQKTAKLIGLLEELRRDLPNVSDRHDSEAEDLSQRADPAAVLEALKESKLNVAEGVADAATGDS